MVWREVKLASHRALDKQREGRVTKHSLEGGQSKAFHSKQVQEDNRHVGVESEAIVKSLDWALRLKFSVKAESSFIFTSLSFKFFFYILVLTDSNNTKLHELKRECALSPANPILQQKSLLAIDCLS